jgi:hypothetical protein
MTCPKCGGEAKKIPWDQGTDAEKSGAVRLRAGLHAGAALAAIQGAWLLTKAALSTAWRCSKCNHQWRIW